MLAGTLDDIDIIMHARSLLFNQDQAWVKKDNSGFDVMMGSYDGAEVCELMGAFILDQLQPILGRKNSGLCRHDGLSILKDTSGPAADRLRKKIIKTFERLGLRITIEVNRKAVNYLNITMNLSDGTYRPYLKPNSTPIYVKSNHPPQVLKTCRLVSTDVSAVFHATNRHLTTRNLSTRTPSRQAGMRPPCSLLEPTTPAPQQDAAKSGSEDARSSGSHHLLASKRASARSSSA